MHIWSNESIVRLFLDEIVLDFTVAIVVLCSKKREVRACITRISDDNYEEEFSPEEMRAMSSRYKYVRPQSSHLVRV